MILKYSLFILSLILFSCSQEGNSKEDASDSAAFNASKEPQSVDSSLQKTVPVAEIFSGISEKKILDNLIAINKFDWSVLDGQIAFGHLEELYRIQQILNSSPINNKIDIDFLNQSFPFYLWSTEDLFFQVYIDFGFIRSQAGFDLGNSSLVQYIDAQCAYYPLDSIEYSYSSQYLIDGSNIYSNLGDFGYLKRLSALDSILNKEIGLKLVQNDWKATCERLFSLEYPFWNDDSAIINELDSLDKINWSTYKKPFKVELSVYRKRIMDRMGSEPQYFNNRSGVIYE
jgi:hypothetical protein